MRARSSAACSHPGLRLQHFGVYAHSGDQRALPACARSGEGVGRMCVERIGECAAHTPSSEGVKEEGREGGVACMHSNSCEVSLGTCTRRKIPINIKTNISFLLFYSSSS